jgi:hypothetical protein
MNSHRVLFLVQIKEIMDFEEELAGAKIDGGELRHL